MGERAGVDMVKEAREQRDRDFALILNRQCPRCPHRIGDHAAFADEHGHWVCMIEGCACDGDK